MEQENLLHCSSCGAKLIANSLINTRCAYCGSTLFIKEKFDVKYIPDAIIKFSNTSNDVEKSLKQYIKASDFIDSKVKNKYEIISLSPVYVPCTIFNFGVETNQKTMVVDNNQNETCTEKQSVELFTIIQDGSKNVDDDFIYTIEPFDFTKIQHFNPAYLGGAYTEISDDSHLISKALGKLQRVVVNRIKMDSGLVECNINTIDKTNAYIPIWIANIKSQNTLYNFMMNDTTGVWVTNAKRKEYFGSNKIRAFLSLLVIVVGLLTYKKFFFNTQNGDIALNIYLIIVALTIFGNHVIYPIKRAKSIKNGLIKKVRLNDIKPTKVIVNSSKMTRKANIPEGKNINFYLDGKKI